MCREQSMFFLDSPKSASLYKNSKSATILDFPARRKIDHQYLNNGTSHSKTNVLDVATESNTIHTTYYLTTSAESCSDLAEIFSVASFIYINIIFYALIFFISHCKKVIRDFVFFIFENL